MHRTKRAAKDKCPAWIHLLETDWHILSCPSRSLWRTVLLRTLRKPLTTHHTPNNCEQYSERSSTPRTASDGNIFLKAASAINGLRFRDDTLWMTQEETKRNSPANDSSNSNSSYIIFGPTCSNYGSLATMICMDARKTKKERKPLERLQPRVLVLYAKVDLLLACDKPTSLNSQFKNS